MKQPNGQVLNHRKTNFYQIKLNYGKESLVKWTLLIIVMAIDCETVRLLHSPNVAV